MAFYFSGAIKSDKAFLSLSLTSIYMHADKIKRTLSYSSKLLFFTA